MKNQYIELIKHMQKQGTKFNPPAIEIGVVINAEPLTIKIGDLQLTKDDIWVADFLLSKYKRKMSIPSTKATGSTTEEGITSIGIPNGELEFTEGLKIGDSIACLAVMDRQEYVVLARVVRP
ncbi:DUF2577 domain-containing protein [Clostridium sp. JN-9]|mgnify:CR=1 FL=1|uniref:DUF2577 domain-containing protein n=1 Tax=Clostridium sp. JN-9 TaxID=2507159 RepID=UPI000FFDFFD3|nr:DUF2577 domain-containing protein [Clostridium sp. JN-9]QAT40828.1 DUF2577 domain-containing protein [Clostridium sp. JN-9]